VGGRRDQLQGAALVGQDHPDSRGAQDLGASGRQVLEEVQDLEVVADRVRQLDERRGQQLFSGQRVLLSVSVVADGFQ
jgi:hypothetical protein